MFDHGGTKRTRDTASGVPEWETPLVCGLSSVCVPLLCKGERIPTQTRDTARGGMRTPRLSSRRSFDHRVTKRTRDTASGVHARENFALRRYPRPAPEEPALRSSGGICELRNFRRVVRLTTSHQKNKGHHFGCPLFFW